MHLLRTALVLLPMLCLAPALRAQDEPASLLERAESQVRIDPDDSRRLAEQALAQLHDSPDADLQVQALLLLCEHEIERDRAEAQRRLDAARKLVPGVRRAGLQARLFGCEGELRENGGDSAGALTLYEQAVLAAERADDRENLAQALYHRGYLRGVRGEFANGLSDLKRAAALYDALDRPAHRTTVHNGIAIVYNRMGDAQQARRFYESALKDQQAAGLKRELVVTWHNLGRVLENLKDWTAAEQAFGESLALSRELGYRRGRAHAMRGLAAVHNARGRPAQAMALLDEAAAIQRSLPDERLRGQIQLHRGLALAQLRRPAESRAALTEALAVFQRAESPAERAQVHEGLAQLSAEQHDWQPAFAQLQAFKEVSDELLRRQIDQRFAALRIEVDTTTREQEMRLLQREQQATAHALDQERLAGRLRNVSLVLGAVLAALLALLAWRLRRTGLAMQQLALTDELTGLPNRRDLLARLDAQLRQGERCALLIVDLDHFKRINDSHGHPAGDAVLRATADALRDVGRAPVAIGRLGGEEFVLLLPGADAPSAAALGERLRAAVAALDLGAIVPDGHLTTSVGITVSAAGDQASDLLRRADGALYAAKAGGRNRVELVLPEAGDAALGAALKTPKAPDRNRP